MKMKKKIIPVIVALVLIVLVGVVGFGRRILDKYTYSKEQADLNEYYGVQEGELAILLQDDWMTEKAVLRDEAVYFDLDTIHAYLNEGFYADMAEKKLLYTTANDTASVLFDEKQYSDRTGMHPVEYTICYTQGDKVYVAADYVRQFTNYSYSLFDRHLQVYTQWGERQTLDIAKDTQIRLLGGIKSPILREMEEGETVEVLEEMET